MILLVRDDRFLKNTDKLYNVGSSSNDLYRNNIYCMGEFYNLSWTIEASSGEVINHEELELFNDMHLVANDNNLSFIKKCAIIRNNVKQNKIIVAKMSLFQAIVASHYALKYKKVLVLESASDLFSALWFHGGSVKYKLAAFPLDLLVKYYHLKANYIVYVSKEFLQKKYRSNAVSIGCSDAVLSKPQDVFLEKRINKISTYSKDKEYILGLIGATQAEYRGHDILIKVCARLISKGYSIKVKFLGGGSADSKRIKYAKKYGVQKNIEFSGRLQHHEVIEWLQNIDIMVMPTKVESLGRAVLEAMSTACPVIGTRTTALRELLPVGCLVHPTDYVRISDIIEKMINNQSFMIDCAIANYKKACEYSSDITNEMRKKFYQEIITKERENAGSL